MKPHTVTAGETGVIRIFTIDLPVDNAADFADDMGAIEVDNSWPLQTALGAADLDPAFVDVFPASDLEGVGLADYLIDGTGISADDIAPFRAQLDGLTGNIVVIHSRAFKGVVQTLSPKAPLHYIATFQEDRAPVTFEPLPNPDPAPAIEDLPQKKTPSDAAMGGRVATIALLVMGLLVWLMIWVAG